jgi:tetratricopeptide (TPR) repeat protein
MDKPGRNQACLCGSGKKYKQCCLEKDEAAASGRAHGYEALPKTKLPTLADWAEDADWSDGLDEASNAVLDLIKAGKLDEAEQAARDLRAQFPEVIDGIERLAMVCEARGDTTQAAAHYREALDFIRENPEGFDEEATDHYRRKLSQLESTSA